MYLVAHLVGRPRSVDTCTVGVKTLQEVSMRKASKHVQPYPPEFRAEAIRLARTSGKPHGEIAQDVGMTSETLRLWLKQADLDEGKRHDGLTSEEQEELRRLRRENRILREEREILQICPAFFARETDSSR
jgi:transposase